MKLRLVPENVNVDFLSKRKVAVVLSLLLIIASAGLFFTRGLNYGIDFKGGLAIEIGMDTPVPLADVRRVASGLGLGDVSVQEYGAPTEALIRVERQPGESEAQVAALDAVKAALDAEIEGIHYRQENIIGPKVSGELKRDGALAVGVAIFAVLVYIWFRFEWQFGLGAVIALVHDVILTIGFFSITGLEFNLSVIAALLTIVGYSLNDTVVVYDRVRENIRRFRKLEFADLLNTSLNQTLSRTVTTSLTTLLALIALYIFGGAVIQAFTAAMIWGVIVGTYSSIFVAVPVLTLFDIRRDVFYSDEETESDPTVFKG